MSELKDIIAKARNLPPLSPSALKLIELMGDEDHGIHEVAQVVEYDSNLTAHLLKVVNSPFFGLREPVTTVRRAITYLGERMVISIALNLCAPHVFHKPLDGYDSRQGELWAHSLKTAFAARELAFNAVGDEVNAELAFTAGIVHDIGKSVLSQYLTGLPEKMAEKFDRGEVQNHLEAEEAVVGTNHCAIGYELAKHWRLPPALLSTILHHHTPAKADPPYRPLAYIIHLGDMVSMMEGAATGGDALAYPLDADYPKYVKINRPGLYRLLLTVTTEFERARSSFMGDEKEEGA